MKSTMRDGCAVLASVVLLLASISGTCATASSKQQVRSALASMEAQPRPEQQAKFLQVPPNQGADEPPYPMPNSQTAPVPAELGPSATGEVRSDDEELNNVASDSGQSQAAADAAAMASAQAALASAEAAAATTTAAAAATAAPQEQQAQSVTPQPTPVAVATPPVAGATTPTPVAGQVGAVPAPPATPQSQPTAPAKTWSVWTGAPTTTTRSSGSLLCSEPKCEPTPPPQTATMMPAYTPPPETTTPAPRKITPEQALVLDGALSASQAQSAASVMAGSAASVQARAALRAAGAATNAAVDAMNVASASSAKAMAVANDLASLRGLRSAAGVAHSQQLNNIYIPAPRWPAYVPLPPVLPR